MERWRLTYAVNDGSGMFGLEPPATETLDVDIDSAGKEEAEVLDEMRAAVHRHVGAHSVLTDAEKLSG